MRRLATAPSPDGVLVIDDTGDRKYGHATDHVARHYLGSVGKVDNGIVAVTTLWASDRGRNARCGHHLGDPAAPHNPGLRSSEGAPLALVEVLAHELPALGYG